VLPHHVRRILDSVACLLVGPCLLENVGCQDIPKIVRTVTPTSAATRQHDIAIPMFGYKNHAGIDRTHGFIRGWTVTGAIAHDGAQLRNVVAKNNTASSVWADSAYRSKTNEEWLERNGLTSDIHQRKPKGKPMPEAMSRANGRRSKVRSAVEHVFARQKDKMKRLRKVNAHRSKMIRAAFAYAACRRAISSHICMASVLSSRWWSDEISWRGM